MDLKPYMRTVDHFFCSDLWQLTELSGTTEKG